MFPLIRELYRFILGALTQPRKGKKMEMTYLNAFLAFLGMAGTLASAFPDLVLQHVKQITGRSPRATLVARDRTPDHRLRREP